MVTSEHETQPKTEVTHSCACGITELDSFHNHGGWSWMKGTFRMTAVTAWRGVYYYQRLLCVTTEMSSFPPIITPTSQKQQACETVAPPKIIFIKKKTYLPFAHWFFFSFLLKYFGAVLSTLADSFFSAFTSSTHQFTLTLLLLVIWQEVSHGLQRFLSGTDNIAGTCCDATHTHAHTTRITLQTTA